MIRMLFAVSLFIHQRFVPFCRKSLILHDEFKAKQRYNSRVTEGVAEFVGLKNALEQNDIDAVRAYFSSEEVGAWKDFTAAGYLLANAFRTNSSAAPDALPSVKVRSLVLSLESVLNFSNSVLYIYEITPRNGKLLQLKWN
jgi:hypothetical protein